MSRGSWIRVLALGLLLALAGAAAEAEELLVSTPLVDGSLATVSNFQITGPGTVTVSLTDLAWPDKLASLTFAATTSSGVVASMSGPGQISFNVSSPGMYSAVVGAVAGAGFLDLGWYSMIVNFTPATSAVPLPGSVWLLVSGLVLGALLIRPRRRATPAYA